MQISTVGHLYIVLGAWILQSHWQPRTTSSTELRETPMVQAGTVPPPGLCPVEVASSGPAESFKLHLHIYKYVGAVHLRPEFVPAASVVGAVLHNLSIVVVFVTKPYPEDPEDMPERDIIPCITATSHH